MAANVPNLVNALKQPVLTTAIVSVGKLLGSKIEKLNLEGDFKKLAASAFAISGSFKVVDYASATLIESVQPLKSYQLGIKSQPLKHWRIWGSIPAFSTRDAS